jgi:lysylphosphatidylglycerol synthetase-like protein (DUF2156 family)
VTDFAPYQGSAFQPPPLAVGPLRPLRIPAWIATAALGLIGLEALIAGGLQASLYPATVSTTEATDAQVALSMFLIEGEPVVAVLLMMLTGIAFVVWLHRARTNLEGPGWDLTWTRGWSIGGWFIPLANTVIPQLVVYEVDRYSERLAEEAEGRPHRRRRAAAVAWVTMWSIFLAGSQLVGTVLDELDPGPSVLLGAALGLFEAATAGSAIVLVWHVTTNQERARLAQQRAAFGA